MHRTVLVVSLLISLYSTDSAIAAEPSHSSDSGIPESQRNLVTEVERLVLPLVAQNMISGSVLVARNDEILVNFGFGLADREHDSANTTSTPYRIASVSKSITAVAVLQLVDRGLLGLDDTLDVYLPGFENGEKITIAHLLGHQSGIPSDVYLPEFGEVMVAGKTLDEALDWIRGAPARFKPGDKFEYSNSGYLVLSAIIEKVSGQPFETYLKENVFDPAEMATSGLDATNILLAGRARGYSRTESGTVAQTAYRHPSYGWGYGALYSTTSDLYRFSRALDDGVLLSDRSLTLMMKPQSDTPWKNQYGLGWFVDELNGQKVVSALGSTGGFAATVRIFPDADTTVIVLLNHDFLLYDNLFEQLSLIALGKPWTPLFDGESATARTGLSAFVGAYEMDDGEITVFKNIGGKLVFGSLAADAFFDVYAIMDRIAYVPALNARLRFTETGEGQCELLALYGNYAWWGKITDTSRRVFSPANDC